MVDRFLSTGNSQLFLWIHKSEQLQMYVISSSLKSLSSPSLQSIYLSPNSVEYLGPLRTVKSQKLETFLTEITIKFIKQFKFVMWKLTWIWKDN